MTELKYVRIFIQCTYRNLGHILKSNHLVVNNFVLEPKAELNNIFC